MSDCFHQGSIHIFDPADANNIKCLFDVYHGVFMAVDVLAPGNEFCVVSTGFKPRAMSSVW